LVGFSGKLPDGSNPCKTDHDYQWEQLYYKNNKVETIILDDIIDFEL